MEQTEVLRIIDQFNRLYDGECWTGSSIKEILEDIDPITANIKLPFVLKSIHEIVRHLLSTEYVVKKRLMGSNHELTTEEDWPVINNDKEFTWGQTKLDIHNSNKELLRKINELNDKKLDREIIKGF